MNRDEPISFGAGGFGIGQSEVVDLPTHEPWRRWRWRAAACIGVLLAASIALSAYGPLLSGAPAVKYRLAAVDAGPIVSTVAAAGTLKPLAAILVGSQASGQIKKLLVDFNTLVKAGDVMAQLDDDAVRARLAQAGAEVEVSAAAVEIQRAQLQRAQADTDNTHAALLVTQADAERAEATLKDAERERERKSELFARGVGSTAERDRSDIAYDTARAVLAAAKARVVGAISAEFAGEATVRIARAQLENALAQVKQREAIVQQVRVELDHTLIRAPIDGVVIDRTVDVGQTVAASLQAPTLFTIAPDLRAMELHASVDEADIGRVGPGQVVSFTVDSYPDRTFRGRVIDIRKMPLTTQNVVAYTVVVSAENEDLLLLPGMTANVRILVQQRDNVLRLPNAALRFRPAGTPARPVTTEGNPTYAQLVRAAVDRIGLPPARRAEIEQVIRETDCPVVDAKDASSATEDGTRAQACQEATKRILPLLSSEERTQYLTVRWQLAREQKIASADVWMVGPRDMPQARRVALGITDGLVTEIVAGDLHKDDRVITAADAQPARSAGIAGL